MYRPYGEFLRERRVFCKEHIPEEGSGYYVPLFEDIDGEVWGYTSAPLEAIERWKSLPEVATARNDVDFWPWRGE